MKKPTVALLDYGVGNLFSVANALNAAGANTIITNEPAKIAAADRVMLPGVGAMRDAMAHMKAEGVDIAVKEALATKPVMAICVGMQAVFEHSEEGSVECLGILKGRVKRLNDNWLDTVGKPIKVPHVGWNRVDADTDHPLWDGCNHQFYYFTHSYYCDPVADDTQVLGMTKYGIDFCSSVIKDNLFVTQFHPEKSHDAGLKLLSNFINWQI